MHLELREFKLSIWDRQLQIIPTPVSSSIHHGNWSELPRTLQETSRTPKSGQNSFHINEAKGRLNANNKGNHQDE